MPSLRLDVESVVAGGAGLARQPGGRVVFVDGALPGETVEAEIIEERRDYARARLLEVEAASPHRVSPPCPLVAAGCGGCGWQHVDRRAQRRLKEEIIADALHRVGRLRTPPPITTAPAALDGGRTTLRLGVVDGFPAFRRRHSTALVPVDRCMVAHPRLVEVMSEARFPGAEEVLLRMSEATGEVIALVTPPSAVAGSQVPSHVRVGANHRSRVKAAREPALLSVVEEVAGQRLRVSGDAFFQASAAVAGALVRAVATAAGHLGGKRVVDAYGGVGLFAKAVAAAHEAASIVVIESDAVAARDARHNLAGLAARVLTCEVGRWRPSPADVVIADPARPGLARPGVRALTAAAPSTIVLVSCDAASLARDAGLLTAAGYECIDVVVVDAFPNTPHIEAVTRFVRAKGTNHRKSGPSDTKSGIPVTASG